MRYIRRLLDRRSSAVVIAAYCMAASAASCSSGDEEAIPTPSDSRDAALSDTSQVAADAEVDVSMPGDATVFDGGPMPVVCTSSPCARSLVTTLPTAMPVPNAPTEGFCALLDDGTVTCWGANVVGQLGRGDEAGTADSPTPARVVGLSDVVELDHTCARTTTGEVWCWGRAPYVRNGAAVIASERAPVQIPIPAARRIGVSVVGNGAYNTGVGCADTDDGFFCWGSNDLLQIVPTVAGMLPPTRIDLPPGAPILDILVGSATAVAGGGGVGGATFVLREDGSTLSWGGKSLLARVSSLNPDPYPTPTALGPTSSVDMTSTSACATVAGTGYCWGTVDTLELPVQEQPSQVVNAFPEPVVTPEPVVGIATTDTAAFTFEGVRIVRLQRWCAVGASGAVYCWGLNAHGQAGDGTKDHAYNAVKVEGLPAPAAEVKTMPLSTCALLTTGKVYCWGNNFYGQLGTGSLKGGSLTPQEVVLP